MPEITLTLPLPCAPGYKYLWPNKRSCWQAKGPQTKAYRKNACSAAWVAMAQQLGSGYAGLPWKNASEQCTFYFPTGHQRDPDNCLAAMKPGFDGLQDSGLLANDRDLTHMPVVRKVDKDKPRVEVRVWEVTK